MRRFLDGDGINVSRGLVAGTSHIHKFAYNSTVGASLESIWTRGGIFPWQQIAATCSVVSTLAADTSAGAGARTVRIEGLDENHIEQSVDVTMAGTTPVITTGSLWTHIYRAYVITAGALEGASGTITFTNTNSTDVVAEILNGYNQTLMSQYTIPAGKTGYLMMGKISADQGKDARFEMYIRPFGEVFRVAFVGYVFQNNFEYTFQHPLAIPEKTDIDIRAISVAAGAGIACNYDIMLIDNAPTS